MITLQTAIITGAGSGVGRAVAVKLSAQGWKLCLVGRRAEPLRETAALAGSADAIVSPMSVGNVDDTKKTIEEMVARWGRVDALVNAAGTNVPRRSLEVLSQEDYHLMMDSNLNGAYYFAQGVLPYMRRQGAGTIVNIVSDAARQASAKAGPAYAMSKFGMLGLTQAINAEERPKGIRACAVLPGDIDTPLLDKRPAPPDATARARMLQPEDVADCALLAINLPDRAVVEELLIRPRG